MAFYGRLAEECKEIDRQTVSGFSQPQNPVGGDPGRKIAHNENTHQRYATPLDKR